MKQASPASFVNRAAFTALALAFVAIPLQGCSSEAPSGGIPFGHGGRGAIDKSGDMQLQALIAETLPRFKRFEYTDKETGLKIPYNLYIPQPQAGTGPLPMVTFIADASTVGKAGQAPLRQGLGGLIWASPDAQARHSALVLVPEFPEVAIDDHGAFTTTPYVELTRRLVLAVAKEHGADTKRLYATGQSMGCMIFLLLSAKYPDLFASEIFVSGQWNIAQLNGLSGQRFAYIASAGDAKASGGQAEVRAALSRAGVTLASAVVDGNASQQDQDAAATAMLAQGKAANFIVFDRGSVLPRGVTSPGDGGDHMYSFDPAYRLAPVRNWMFGGRTKG